MKKKMNGQRGRRVKYKNMCVMCIQRKKDNMENIQLREEERHQNKYLASYKEIKQNHIGRDGNNFT